MKRLVLALLRSLPALANVVIFLLFFFLLFSILGVNQFQGVMYNRCRTTELPLQEDGSYTTWPIAEDTHRLCSLDSYGWYQCPTGTWCGHPDEHDLKLSHEDITNRPEVNYGITNFNNLFAAIITIFQVITLEGWVDVMYNVILEYNIVSLSVRLWMEIIFTLELFISLFWFSLGMFHFFNFVDHFFY
jgi:voltage-dependent calcium channel L type alpha-1D